MLNLEINNLQEQVRQRLLDWIIAGDLPSGSVLREGEIAERLGVSRTPIREALQRLSVEGFVEVRRNRSATVRQLDAQQLVHVYQVREALEAIAAELACGQLLPADFDRFAALALAVGPAGEGNYAARCHQFDVDLHRTIAVRTGNPVLAREIEKLHALVQLMRDRVGNRDNALEVAQSQHLEIIAALQKQQPSEARAAMVRHIRTSCEVAVASMNAAKTARDSGTKSRSRSSHALR